MIVSFNTNYNFTPRANAISPANCAIFKSKNLVKAVRNPVAKDIATINKAMSATEVLDKLRILQKEYKHNRNSLSEYAVGEFLDSVDLENAQRHLDNLESLLKAGSREISNICSRGYFCSNKGAEAIEFAITHFNTEDDARPKTSADYALSILYPDEILNIKSRGLIDLEKSNNYWLDDIGNLAKLSKKEYNRYIESGQDTLYYVSENESVNEFLRLAIQNVDYFYSIDIKDLRKIDNIIQKVLLPKDNNSPELLDFYTRILADLDYKVTNIKKVFSDVEKLKLYKKAHNYIDEKGMGDAKVIIIEDPNKENYHKAGGIASYRDSNLRKEKWELALFDPIGNFIRYNCANNNGVHVSEKVITKDSERIFNASLEKKGGISNIVVSDKKVLDSNGNVVFIERYIKSNDIPNKYNIYREFPNGEKYKIGLAEVSENGNLVIEKTLTTSKGMRTDYNYVESPDGSRLSYVRIVDTKGNVTVENKYKYQVIDNDHFKTTENGIDYYIQYRDSILGSAVRVITSDDREINLIIGGNSEQASGVLSKDLLPLLKRMPGSFYFDIKKYGLKKIGLNKNILFTGSRYNSGENIISLSKYSRESDFTLAHEFGHYLNKFKKISENPEVVKIFLKERETFMTNETQYETFATNYMIDAFSLTTKNYEGSLEELVAETNAFLYASNDDPSIEMRGQFIQEHFPETFAKIANLLLQK